MSEKRFPALPKKLIEAKQRGDTPRAPLLTRSAAMLGATLGLWWQAPTVVGVFQNTPWLDWSFLWWTNTRQLSASLFWIVSLAALFAYVLGSLAGGFVFSLGARESGSRRTSLLAALASLLSFALFIWILLERISSLSWMATREDAFVRGIGVLLGFLWASIGIALLLGVGQAIFSWYFWNQHYRRSFQEFAQDAKDEEGKARQFFAKYL
jgi:type III secretory pathway component EscU